MERWSNWVLKHRRLVVLFWVIVTVAGGAVAGPTTDRLSFSFSLPGQPGYEANQRIVERFGSGGENDPLVLVATASGTSFNDPTALADFTSEVAQVGAAAPGSQLYTPSSPGGEALVSEDGHTATALLYPTITPGLEPYAASLPAVQQAAAATNVGGAPIAVTGVSALMSDTGGGEGRGLLFETMLGGLGALVVLALVFGSLLAGVPLLVAVVSILATFLCLFGLTHVIDVSFIVQFLIALIGLGVAIDYSLLIVMRWREEHAAGADDETAVHNALMTAGRSVMFSGVTVAISLAALIAVPIPFMQSIGFSGLLIPLMSVLTATTLLPVLLLKVGTRLSWPRRSFTDPSSKAWRAIATGVVRRPIVVAVVALAALVVLALPVRSLQLGSAEIRANENGGPASVAAERVLDAGLPAGLFHPVMMLAPQQAVTPLISQLPKMSGAAAVLTGASMGGETQLVALTAADTATGPGRHAVASLDHAAHELGATSVGGLAVQDADFVGAAYGRAPLVLAIVGLATFVLLARALRSIWLPVKALVLNAISLAAAFGITTWIWQGGHGTEAIFDTAQSGAITTWLPSAAFAFLFGLSMDYEVFILSRIREAYDEHGDTKRAAVDGIARTGRLVTSAAAILFLAFVALSTVPGVDTKILATSLALGIAIDALIVRAFLAPALVTLMGKYNWWWPKWLPSGKPVTH